MMQFIKVFFAAFFVGCVVAQPAYAAADKTPSIGYKVVRTYPHRAAAFTQGLEFVGKGRLLESTGLYGRSGLALLNLADGKVLREIKLPEQLFGEGATVFGDDVYQLTWRAGKALVYGRNTLVLRKTLHYKGEGWGLTHNGEHLIMSNGTPDLVFRAPDDFRELRRVKVMEQGRPLAALNELEWIAGLVFANVWRTDRIVLIHPQTGAVLAQINVAPLHKGQPGDTNGIAWHPTSQHLLITGKNWNKIFALRLKSLPRIK